MSKPRATRTFFAVLLAAGQVLLGCPAPNPPLAPAAGLSERREPNLVAVPGGHVDVAGGKLLLRRTDLELDTRLGRESFCAVWDSLRKSWLWSFEMRYDGATFVDDSGASFAVAALPAGAAIPGTYWVKRDATRIATKGGLVHEFGSEGRLAARYWASDPFPRIVHESASVAGALRTTALVQCTSATACSPLFTLGYDAAGRLVSVLDRAGRRAEFAWDAYGRLVAARDGLDVQRGWPGFRYTHTGYQIASVTNSEGERIEYGYQGPALVSVRQIGPGTPEHRFQHEGRDGNGLHHTRFWNPVGEERRYAYDTAGRLLEERAVASGETTAFVWSGERLVAKLEPSGATTTFTWAGDDVVARTDPSGNVVTFTYAPNGVNREEPRRRAIAAVSDSVGTVETRSYDAAGRLVRHENGAGEATEYTWADGVLASVTRGGVTRRFHRYGEHGHPEQVEVLGQMETRLFDAVGNRLRGVGDAPTAGGIDERTFDADRNLATLTLEPQGGTGAALTIALAYRSDGQRTQVLRGGDDHEFVYDAFGRVAEQRERSDGAWHATRFTWDAAGRILSVERPNGMREDLAYGPAGRVTRVERRQGGVLESALDLVYEDGLLVEVADTESGVERYAYDGAGRRVATTFAGGERVDTVYDLRSRVVAEGFTSATGAPLTLLSYAHDLADRRVGIADPTGMLWSASHAGGRLAELRYGNGLVRTFSYLASGILYDTTTRDGAGDVVEATALETGFVLDADARYRILQRATTTTYGATDVTTFEEYQLAPYPDGLPGSWVGPRIAAWNDGFSEDEGYAFDAKSNLLARGDTNFEYNAEGNRLLGVSRGGESVGSYAWDAAGFATARNGVPLAWNAAGRLVAHGADQLVWDGLGRLRSSVVGGVAAHFAFGGRVQTDAAGHPLALDLGEVVVGLGGAHRYRHLDFRGNVKFVSDDAGDVVAHYRYGPFGLDAVFGADDDPVRFVARAEVGDLMLLGVRVYDPAVGRFLSPDPLFQLVNQFAYTLGNPIWFSDPDGMAAEANDSAAAIAQGLADVAAGLALVATVLHFFPVPQARVVAMGLSLLAAILVMLAVFTRRSSGAGYVTHIQAIGGAGGGTSGFDGAPAPGCSPAALTALPPVDGWLRWLLPLQLLLGLLVLRRRRARGLA